MRTLAAFVSLHTADPGTTGANEVVGGAYIRKAITWSAPKDGVITSTNRPRLSVVAGSTITHVGFWSAATGGTWCGEADVADVAYPSVNGNYVVIEAAMDLQGPRVPLPEAPTNLIATALSASQIGLTWSSTSLSDIDFYRVERSISPAGTADNDPSWTVVGNNIGTTSYTDGGLQPLTEYFFRVFTYNAAGDSDPSGIASAQTLDVTGGVPDAVVLTATALSSTRIQLSWDASAGAETYRVELVEQGISTNEAPGNTGIPSITGTPALGLTLTASTGTWSGNPTPTFAYQWQRCASGVCSDISSATKATYVPVTGDVGATIRVRVTATNTEGTASANSLETAPVTGTGNPPVNTVTPAVAGSATVGSTLTCSQGTWTGDATITYAYQWQRCSSTGTNCTDITGATGSTRILTAADDGTQLRGRVTATNSVASVPAFSNLSATVTGTDTGTVVVMGGGDLTYQRGYPENGLAAGNDLGDIMLADSARTYTIANGDCTYNVARTGNFATHYKPSRWHQLKASTLPAIGNHENGVGGPCNSPAQGEGYISYFDKGGVRSYNRIECDPVTSTVNVDLGPPVPYVRQPGTTGQAGLYHHRGPDTVGIDPRSPTNGWLILALDNTEGGNESAGSPQVTWLNKMLNTGATGYITTHNIKGVFAFMHYDDAWPGGSGKGAVMLKVICDAAKAAGRKADIVTTGHKHSYTPRARVTTSGSTLVSSTAPTAIHYWLIGNSGHEQGNATYGTGIGRWELASGGFRYKYIRGGFYGSGGLSTYKANYSDTLDVVTGSNGGLIPWA